MNVFVTQLPNVAYPLMGKVYGCGVIPVDECRDYIMPVGMVPCLYCEYTISGGSLVDSLS